MKLIKAKVSFTIVEDVEAHEEYYNVTKGEIAKRMQDTNFLQNSLKAYEEEIKETFTFSSHSGNKKIDLGWVENFKIELEQFAEEE